MASRRQDKMEENRAKLISAARKAFGSQGFAQASMDDLTAAVGLTRGALYHNFGDKKGLLAAVVAQLDGEMAASARAAGARASDGWAQLSAEGEAYIAMALDPEVRRIVLLDVRVFHDAFGHQPFDGFHGRLQTSVLAGPLRRVAKEGRAVEQDDPAHLGIQRHRNIGFAFCR